ncbi:7-alpha-hydroxysteroid dehydrogenase [Exophiala aquamarina CBS 119918]|uniref:7-alpha-hydroxysteroid dehydrogenase n=1 Tax=Exophiala aquamarina CBS 119918 TaxID=1182545 RepID=A0A072NVZ8_9EURO|nr:7-alpha-hydroxysteroid dehydrogenase [Exophiala aquamarina CBS 119918]KEF52054.1 7-alpha-hydroxysteroid dehydrogenase [Exophiala aquamarina CBS 119918]
MATSKAYAIIAGVGPGTGAAIAKKFAQAYSVVLLARSTSSYSSLEKEINDSGGDAFGVSTDVSSPDSINNVLQEIDAKFGADSTCAAAIFNAAGKLTIKPFLEQTEEAFLAPFNVNCIGGFHFSQAVLPLLLKATNHSTTHPPTLIFTGATASLKASANFSSFAVSKFATRALVQSLTREFGPKGIHVAHAIIDGIIDTPGTADFMKDAGPDAKISPETIAETYWYLHTQPKSGFTNELEIRPSAEKW